MGEREYHRFIVKYKNENEKEKENNEEFEESRCQ